MEWLGHDLLRALQSALCLLPNFDISQDIKPASQRESTPPEIATMMMWLQVSFART